MDPRILNFVTRWMLGLRIAVLVGNRDGLDAMSNRAGDVRVYSSTKYSPCIPVRSMDGLTDGLTD
jgi:hypothetical protein